MTDLNFRTHTVEKGETIHTVAKKYAVPRDLIAEANSSKIKDPNAVHLQAGQSLIIPAKYTAQPNDTPSAVAERFGIQPDLIVDVNGRSVDTLQPGQSVYILPSSQGTSWPRTLGIFLALLLLVMCGVGLVWGLLGLGSTQENLTVGIVAPLPAAGETMVKTLLYSPVQIKSNHISHNISRVELWIKAPQDEIGKLQRSDVPINSTVLQQWIPQQLGEHTIIVKAFYKDEPKPTEYTAKIEVLDNLVISLATVEVASQEYVPPTPRPAQAQPSAIEGAAPDAQIAVVQMDVVPTAEATPVRRYPPPPPAPGVPPGPTQAEFSDFGPPVCDAAKFVSVYTADTNRRVVITEPDDVPARAVGGTTVHRAWRLQNIGTCTWGPGYELSFYGGRAMGSGGVAFEAPYPSDPGRRNAIIDNNRLIVPEGKPNQTAIVEVLLNTPVTPGIHQSYWRMRNPHGVYFGPILGVTIEVVRDCQHGVYGAPVINQFEILGVGNVYRPDDPVNVLAKLGDAVTLQYNVINASNFDIVMEDPTGNVQSTSTPDPSGRVSFTPKTLGRHIITLYADNGSCTVVAQVYVDVIPPDGEQFRLDLILSGAGSTASAGSNISYSSAVPVGSIGVEWNHFDPEANDFVLATETYKRMYTQYCPVVNDIFGWKGHCYMTWTDWQPVNQPLTVAMGGEAQGAAIVSNLETKMCPSSYDPTREEYGLRYVMRASKNGRPAYPEYSNTVDMECPATSSQLPTELQQQQFDP